MLFRETEPSDRLFVIREGRVQLYQTRENGSEFTFGICASGTLLGLASLVLNRPNVLPGQAIDRVMASVIRRADFFRCMEAVPKLQANILELLAMLALESIERSVPMALDPASARLGSTLLRLAKPAASGVERSRCEVVGLSHEELGKMIGPSRTWVGLTLAEFERRGLLTKTRGRLTIPDTGLLAKAVAELQNADR
ncbi:Crp/Fnr family transcriptional regulator [Microvirga roseola]|uniref:Crp/Fnr family transcriptional regulator n=1 Tax=Microvirga roseola TaxID=2883126 RepID=UPI001E5B7478|nr:Crp/Fnr family transcriptional regulator [Microvirga roseola]